MFLDRMRLFFLEDSPFFEEIGMAINFLGETPGSFSINSVPVNPIVKKYVDGGSLRQYMFTITYRDFYDCEDFTANVTIASFEFLTEWIDEANKKNILPKLDNGFVPVSLEVVSTAQQKNHKAARAVYEIKCRLLYEKKGDLNL